MEIKGNVEKMKTFKELYDSTQKYNKKYAKTNGRLVKDIDGKLVDIIPNVRAKMITFRFRVKSQSKINEGYNVWIQFYNVEFSDHPISSTSIKILDKETKEPLYFERISLTNKNKQNYVRVRCSCMDFRFRFSWEDRAVQALYGAPPAKYTRKPGSNRPPVNPEHMPGFCKHVYQCAKAIEHYFAK